MIWLLRAAEAQRLSKPGRVKPVAAGDQVRPVRRAEVALQHDRPGVGDRRDLLVVPVGAPEMRHVDHAGRHADQRGDRFTSGTAAKVSGLVLADIELGAVADERFEA
jgi:hypothetical protein